MSMKGYIYCLDNLGNGEQMNTSLPTKRVWDYQQTQSIVRLPSGFAIQKGNRKLGPIPSFSTLPGVTCQPGVPCRDGCYAIKMCRIYADTRRIWAENTALIQSNAFQRLEDELSEYIAVFGVRAFRWHVSGDIPDEAYLYMMCNVADNCPDCQFFAFTKNYQLVADRWECIPDNLCIILSAWGDYQPTPEQAERFAVSYVVDKKGRLTVPDGVNATACPGYCLACRHCMTAKHGDHIAFNKH